MGRFGTLREGAFRAIDLGVSLQTRDAASREVQAKVNEHAADGSTEFPQGDTDGKKNQILIPVVAREKLHRNFRILTDGEHHSSARELIREIAYAFLDGDGNYTKDFQTTGFDGRLWEMALFALLYEQRFEILNEWNRPDYCAIKGGIPIGIEGTTIHPTVGKAAPVPKTPDEERALRRDYMPIRFGGVLFTKLRKKYWELPHMRGIPLILAVHDFHSEAR